MAGCGCSGSAGSEITYTTYETAVSGGDRVRVGAKSDVMLITPEKTVKIRSGSTALLMQLTATDLIDNKGAPLWIIAI